MAVVGVYVTVAFDASWPDVAGMGQEKSLESAGDLRVPALVTLADRLLTSEVGQRRHSHLDFEYIRAVLWRGPSCFPSMPGRQNWRCKRGLQEIGEPRPLALKYGCG
jgi:hypothetical protein